VDEINELEYTIGTEGWKVFVAICREGATRATEQLLKPSQDRKDRQPDDYLRGYIAGLRDAVRKPQDVINQRKQADESAKGTTPEE
jgi:hypothetical protein